jgi:hypothetical protein
MKYTIVKDGLGNDCITGETTDGTILWIPSDPANSDYQAYLESLEPKAKAPKVVDEAAPE